MAKSEFLSCSFILFSKIELATNLPSVTSFTVFLTFTFEPSLFSVQTSLSNLVLFFSITLFAASTIFFVDRRTVCLVHQPSYSMFNRWVEDGLLDNPKVDAAMMIHVFAGLPVPTGVVFYLSEGPASASSDWYDITIQGKGGHGASPHSSVDPLIAMSNIHLAINDLVAREVNANDFLVITPCVLQGGTIGNVIPDKAFMQGTIRTYDKKVRDLAKKRIVEIAEGIGKAYRCDVDVKLYRGCPSLINNKDVRDSAVAAAQEIVGPKGVLDASMYPEAGGGRMAGSEDFAYISELVPSTMLGLAANKVHNDGNSYGQHHPKVMFDENALPVGTAVYANTALKWLNNNK